MKLLLLSSSPTQKKIQEEFLKLLGKEPKEIKVALIPTAGYPEIDQKYVDFDKNILKKLGINNLTQIDLKEESTKSLEEKLSDCDVIWVGGGNTFWLLHWVKKSGFDKLLPKLLNQGKIYVSTSAGSIIAGPDISICQYKHDWNENVFGLKDLSGIDLVDFVVSPHYVDKNKKFNETCAKETGVKIVPLKDGEAVVVDNDKVTTVKS